RSTLRGGHWTYRPPERGRILSDAGLFWHVERAQGRAGAHTVQARTRERDQSSAARAHYRTDSRSANRSGIQAEQSAESRRLSQCNRRTAAARGSPYWSVRTRPLLRAALHRQADGAARDVRRSGGDRNRERAAVRGGAGAHGGTERVAAAADRHGRRAQDYQPLDVRSQVGAANAGGVGC